MPIFEYKCSNCNKVFEKVLMKPVKYVKCDCGSEAEKIFSTFQTRHSSDSIREKKEV